MGGVAVWPNAEGCPNADVVGAVVAAPVCPNADVGADVCPNAEVVVAGLPKGDEEGPPALEAAAGLPKAPNPPLLPKAGFEAAPPEAPKAL